MSELSTTGDGNGPVSVVRELKLLRRIFARTTRTAKNSRATCSAVINIYSPLLNGIRDRRKKDNKTMMNARLIYTRSSFVDIFEIFFQK